MQGRVPRPSVQCCWPGMLTLVQIRTLSKHQPTSQVPSPRLPLSLVLRLMPSIMLHQMPSLMLLQVLSLLKPSRTPKCTSKPKSKPTLSVETLTLTPLTIGTLPLIPQAKAELIQDTMQYGLIRETSPAWEEVAAVAGSPEEAFAVATSRGQLPLPHSVHTRFFVEDAEYFKRRAIMEHVEQTGQGS